MYLKDIEMSFDPRKIKKVETHVHLDTCLSYFFLRQLNPKMRLKDFQDEFIAPGRLIDLSDFLTKITAQINILQTKKAIALAVDDLFDQLHADNVIYAELRFAPLLHTQKGLTSEDVVETVIAAMKCASKSYGIEAGLILCTLRHFDASASMLTAELVLKYKGQGVVGLDLAADEAHYPLTNHEAAFCAVRKAGGNVIAHAGESQGAESVLETLNKLHVSRIGHGVRSIESLELVERLKSEGILLEICPSSNITCNVFDRIENHPIDRLKKLGVRLSVNTDARTVVNTTLNKEYQLLHDTFGWGEEDFKRCNIHALESSFLSEDAKIRLIYIINGFVE